MRATSSMAMKPSVVITSRSERPGLSALTMIGASSLMSHARSEGSDGVGHRGHRAHGREKRSGESAPRVIWSRRAAHTDTQRPLWSRAAYTEARRSRRRHRSIT